MTRTSLVLISKILCFSLNNRLYCLAMTFYLTINNRKAIYGAIQRKWYATWPGLDEKIFWAPAGFEPKTSTLTIWSFRKNWSDQVTISYLCNTKFGHFTNTKWPKWSLRQQSMNKPLQGLEPKTSTLTIWSFRKSWSDQVTISYLCNSKFGHFTNTKWPKWSLR